MIVARSSRRRMGVASVEMACLLPFLLILMVGVWELGRLIQMQQVMNNAARAGARVASQANIINTTGAFTPISVTGSSPSVQDAVIQNLKGAGVTNLTGLTISFQYINGNTGLTQPFEGSKNQRFVVSVSLPFANVSWSSLGLINPSTIGGSCTWQILVDDPFSVGTTLPTWDPVNN